MCNNFKQYEAILKSASEAADVLLDMDGGAVVLAWSAELISDLATAENFEGASLAAQKLCEISGVERHQAEQEGQGRGDEKIWIDLFAETLADRAEAAAAK